MVFWSDPGARPSPRSILPGCMDSRVPNCSAIVSGEWLGSITPPAPRRMWLVWAAGWGITTLGADEAIVAMLWCSAYQTRLYPELSASLARATLSLKLSVAVWPLRIGARSRMDRGMFNVSRSLHL